MDKIVRSIVKIVLLTRCSKVALPANEHLHTLVHQYPHPYVEFPLVNQKGMLNILLNYQRNILVDLHWSVQDGTIALLSYE